MTNIAIPELFLKLYYSVAIYVIWSYGTGEKITYFNHLQIFWEHITTRTFM